MKRAASGLVRITRRTRRRLAPAELLRRAARAALAHGARPALELSLVLVDDAELCLLHERFLGDPAPTDVIGFDLSDAHSQLGEVFVSVECAERVARRRGLDPARELALYVVHGCLHLCGHDDHAPAERRRMRAAERRVLAQLGFAGRGARRAQGPRTR